MPATSLNFYFLFDSFLQGNPEYDMLKPASIVERGSSPIVKTKSPGHLPLQLRQLLFSGQPEVKPL